MRQIFIPLMIAALLLAAISCSGGNAVSPLTDDPALTPGTLSHEGQNRSHFLWGLWQFVADPEAGTLDPIQLRTGNFHLNALPFLEPPPLLYLTLETLEFNGDIIDTDIGIRHPFLGLTEFTGFDVCGIFISNGSVTGFDDPDLRMAGDGDTRLLNPDGYARWWNPSEFPLGDTMFSYKDGLLGTPDSIGEYNSTLNGYKYFCDDLDDVTDTLGEVTLENRGMFSAGQKNIRHYTIDTSGGLIFNYAVDACWVFPDGGPPWTAPEDFALEANRPEAWNAVISETENTLWNDGAENGGGLKLEVDVYDWFDTAPNTLKVESPGNFASVISITPIGGGAGFSTYGIEILSATPAEGSIDLLISIESEDVGYGGLLPDKPVTAYFGYEAEVSDEKPAEVEFPVLIDSDKNYWATRFVEDSNGVFHVAASWTESPNREMRWFISTDQGATWESKGDLSNPPSTAGAYAPSKAFQLAADQDGGVYFLYGESKTYGSSPIVVAFLKYLDTSTAGTPADWELSDWQSKRVISLDTPSGAQDCALSVSPSKEILMVTFDYRLCIGDWGLKYNYASNGWDSVVDGSNGWGVDSSLTGSGTGDLYFMYPSGSNNIVYHPGTGHFFYCIGGSFRFEGSVEYTGVCALEFDPDGGANPWEMVAAFQNVGMGNSGSVMQNYHGDMAVDAAGNVHWVHASTYWPYYPQTGWNYNNVQFRFVHGVRNNSTGVWDMSDTPINSTWDFPTPAPPYLGTSGNRYDYEPAYINLVQTSNGILLSWLQSHTYPNYQSSLLQSGGSFDDPPTVQLSASEYPVIVPTVLSGTNTGWASAQGEAVGDQLALPFASKETPSDTKGQLWFTMFSDM